jgi:hypothetical protein
MQLLSTFYIYCVVCPCVLEAVRRNPLTAKATTCEIEESIKLWLRGAPDRHGGRAERARRSAAKKKNRLSSVRPNHGRSRSRSPVHQLNEHDGSSPQSSRGSPPPSRERSIPDRQDGQAERARRSAAEQKNRCSSVRRDHSISRSRSPVHQLNEHDGLSPQSSGCSPPPSRERSIPDRQGGHAERIIRAATAKINNQHSAARRNGCRLLFPSTTPDRRLNEREDSFSHLSEGSPQSSQEPAMS